MQVKLFEFHAVGIFAQFVRHVLLRFALRWATRLTAADLIADILDLLDAVIDTFLDLGLVILDVFCRFHVLDSTPSLLKNMFIVYHISLKKSRALTPKLRFPADFFEYRIKNLQILLDSNFICIFL